MTVQLGLSTGVPCSALSKWPENTAFLEPQGFPAPPELVLSFMHVLPSLWVQPLPTVWRQGMVKWRWGSSSPSTTVPGPRLSSPTSPELSCCISFFLFFVADFVSYLKFLLWISPGSSGNPNSLYCVLIPISAPSISASHPHIQE